MSTKWLGENVCDICKARGVSDPTIKGKKAYDTPTIMGDWAFMCRNCYNTYSTKSCGQEYTRNDNGVFVKVKNIGSKKQNAFLDLEKYAESLL